jgi:hypothetical protein
MNLFSLIGKILLGIILLLLGIILFIILSFLVYWYKMYRDDTVTGRYKGFERVKQSFGAAGLWFLLGLFATFTGKLHNPLNFFLSIYGIKSVDFQ